MEFEIGGTFYHYKNLPSEKDNQEIEDKMFQGIIEAMKIYNETGRFADLGSSSVLENLIIVGMIAGMKHQHLIKNLNLESQHRSNTSKVCELLAFRSFLGNNFNI